MSEKRVSPLGAKTARPCDNCVKKRARWFCAADDAFLCQTCDTTIHAANSLAKRHERVRLKTASSSSHNPNEHPPADHVQPAWHGGFKRKARTSRPHPFPKLTKTEPSSVNSSLLVPELGEESLEENDEQLLYRVPVMDPGLAELCTDPMAVSMAAVTVDEMKSEPLMGNIDGAPGFMPCDDVDLAEFEIDMESLLGRGLEEGSLCMEELGLLESRRPELEWGGEGSSSCSGRVKVEEEEVGSHFENEMDTLELDFDYDTLATCEEEEEKAGTSVDGHVGMEKVGGFSLRLDYEAVMTAWTGQDPPWMTGDRPQFNIDEFWPECTDIYGSDLNQNGDMMVGVHVPGGGRDGGREARVSRYREKRRTRLFQKKIRYEVRKLNAEKRPRMKGRFVKRAPTLHPVC